MEQDACRGGVVMAHNGFEECIATATAARSRISGAEVVKLLTQIAPSIHQNGHAGMRNPVKLARPPIRVRLGFATNSMLPDQQWKTIDVFSHTDYVAQSDGWRPTPRTVDLHGSAWCDRTTQSEIALFERDCSSNVPMFTTQMQHTSGPFHEKISPKSA
ncbi:hypothetical protein [Mycobacterium sp.]|uniref:hypothetical protein n=1 Tax=Mycobacterium sp. TaxID=1785 RepID=UPI0025795FFA|nr:hypothetical protein [Mycobacterium sp.]